jgi:hypothetical protein
MRSWSPAAMYGLSEPLPLFPHQAAVSKQAQNAVLWSVPLCGERASGCRVGARRSSSPDTDATSRITTATDASPSFTFGDDGTDRGDLGPAQPNDSLSRLQATAASVKL